MKLDIVRRTYNTFGGHKSLGGIPETLLQGAPDFGTAIASVQVTLAFADPGPPHRSLVEKFEEFHARRKTLPKIVFRRKQGVVEIEAASEWVEGA